MFVTHDKFIAAVDAVIDMCDDGLITPRTRDVFLGRIRAHRNERTEVVAENYEITLTDDGRLRLHASSETPVCSESITPAPSSI